MLSTVRVTTAQDLSDLLILFGVQSTISFLLTSLENTSFPYGSLNNGIFLNLGIHGVSLATQRVKNHMQMKLMKALVISRNVQKTGSTGFLLKMNQI